MRGLFKLFLIVLALFLWAAYRSGAVEKVETAKVSEVPGVPNKVSVEYRWNRERFVTYVRSFIPR